MIVKAAPIVPELPSVVTAQVKKLAVETDPALAVRPVIATRLATPAVTVKATGALVKVASPTLTLADPGG